MAIVSFSYYEILLVRNKNVEKLDTVWNWMKTCRGTKKGFSIFVYGSGFKDVKTTLFCFLFTFVKCSSQSGTNTLKWPSCKETHYPLPPLWQAIHRRVVFWLSALSNISIPAGLFFSAKTTLYRLETCTFCKQNHTHLPFTQLKVWTGTHIAAVHCRGKGGGCWCTVKSCTAAEGSLWV